MKAKGEKERARGVKKRDPRLDTHTERERKSESVQRQAQKKPVTPPDSFQSSIKDMLCFRTRDYWLR